LFPQRQDPWRQWRGDRRHLLRVRDSHTLGPCVITPVYKCFLKQVRVPLHFRCLLFVSTIPLSQNKCVNDIRNRQVLNDIRNRQVPLFLFASPHPTTTSNFTRHIQCFFLDSGGFSMVQMPNFRAYGRHAQLESRGSLTIGQRLSGQHPI